jgi:hypothetical protein
LLEDSSPPDFLKMRATRSLLFTNIYLTVGDDKILRASSICKIPSGDGLSFGKARLVLKDAKP